ncbi:MAG: glutamine-hydrolyzing GMP synthase [Candidatus Peribacteraceae bacterium]|jgi:GMP synthase (glutamine-hydrolysing)
MDASVKPGSIVILDCGGQYAHLIGNRVRRLGAFSEIRLAETSAKELKGVAGIILSGGPQSVYEKGSPQIDPAIFDLGVPVLGICYGHQLIAHTLGGTVKPGKAKEYGHADIQVMEPESPLFRGLPTHFGVWMSHGDEVKEVPDGFITTAQSATCATAAMADEARKFFGVQFHLEVTHTQHGMEMLGRFVALCKPAPWSIASYAKEIGEQIRKEVQDRKVFMLVSGGVDSTVAFTLLNDVLGKDRVQGLLVDTGLMRKGEVEGIREAFAPLGITNLRIEDASGEFFTALKNVYDPEEKRKRIGETFLKVQKRVSEEMGLMPPSPRPPSSGGGRGGVAEGAGQRSVVTDAPARGEWLLGQGTIYPDTIETGGTKHADHIKTHHNRVKAVQDMIDAGLVLEPLKDLYKDEVRKLGEELGLPHELVWRHPFPGPGLGVRILCSEREDVGEWKIGNAKLEMPEDIPEGIPHLVLPVKSVGVQGDGRTYRHAVALFSGSDDTSMVPPAFRTMATTIPNTVPAFNRVVFCTSHSKPPALVFTPGAITRERADLLREADAVVNEELKRADLYETVWQFPVVLLPFGTAKGGQSIVLRPVESQEAMTANAAALPPKIIQRITERILDIPGIDMVFLDLTSKPPGTIEWE